MSEIKSGIVSTEFWAMLSQLVVGVIGFFVSMGIVNSADQEAVTKNAVGIIGAIGSLIFNIMTLWPYIFKRTELKKENIRAAVQTRIAERSKPAEVTMEMGQKTTEKQGDAPASCVATGSVDQPE